MLVSSGSKQSFLFCARVLVVICIDEYIQKPILIPVCQRQVVDAFAAGKGSKRVVTSGSHMLKARPGSRAYIFIIGKYSCLVCNYTIPVTISIHIPKGRISHTSSAKLHHAQWIKSGRLLFKAG